MNVCKAIICLGVGWGLLSAGMGAEPESAGGGDVLKVGVIISPPFVMKNAAGHWEGIAFSLWVNAAFCIIGFF